MTSEGSTGAGCSPFRCQEDIENIRQVADHSLQSVICLLTPDTYFGLKPKILAKMGSMFNLR